jgi:prephenate dehydrogenase
VRTGVLGLGLIGGSLLKALAAAGADALGADADPAVAEAVRAAGHPIADGAGELARACDVVVVCVPPDAAAGAVAELLGADERVVVADAASVKGRVLHDVAALVPEAALERFVPAHPLAGAETSGWTASDAGLLRDAVWAVCPPLPAAPPEPLCALSSALAPSGARLLVCTAEEHDAAVARTSHVPHVVAQALARLPAADGLALAAALSGGAYRDMTRTARSDVGLWLGILAANRQSVTAGLGTLIADLERLAGALQEGDAATLDVAWRAGAATREAVDAVRWTEPAWQPRQLPRPAWEELLELGRSGVLVRGLRCAEGTLELDAAG